MPVSLQRWGFMSLWPMNCWQKRTWMAWGKLFVCPYIVDSGMIEGSRTRSGNLNMENSQNVYIHYWKKKYTFWKKSRAQQRLHLCDQKYSWNSNIVKCYWINSLLFEYILKCNLFLMQSWIFSIITPVFSATWSFRNHSNMLICCSIFFIIMFKKSYVFLKSK